MNKTLIVLITIIILVLVAYWYYQLTLIWIAEGSKECITDQDCVVFGKTGDCNCGCYNKGKLPSGTSGECFCLAPTSCKCVSGKCEEVFKESAATAQQIILSDQEVYKLIGIPEPEQQFEYREGPFYHPWTEEKEKTSVDVASLLRDVFYNKNGELGSRLEKTGEDVAKWGGLLEDAPDLRTYFGIYTTFCITESIFYNDLKNTTQRCGYEQNFSFSKGGVDDLTAGEQVLPFFINGYVYYYEGDYIQADYYFNQIKLHHQILENLKYIDLEDGYFQWYKEIYNKVLSFSGINN